MLVLSQMMKTGTVRAAFIQEITATRVSPSFGTLDRFYKCLYPISTFLINLTPQIMSFVALKWCCQLGKWKSILKQ